MAHIPDGVLAAPVLVAGGIASAALMTVALRRLADDQIPQAAVLAAVFFVASLIHIPVGPTSVHPLLTGLMGLVLGWTAVPTIFVALLLQAVFFGFGGLVVLGVNVLNIALPALLVRFAFAPLLRRAERPRTVFLAAAAAGGLAVVLTAGCVCLALALSGSAYMPALPVVAASYGPLALVEAGITGAAVVLIRRVKPELLASGVVVRGT
jgi:cobalt/nickel transport system permease protein